MSFYNQSHLGYYRGGKRVIDFYNNHITSRRERYPFKINQEFVPYVEEMNKNGFCIIKDFFDKKLLLNFKKEVEELFSEGDVEKVREVQNGNHIIVKQPFINTKLATKIAFDQRLIDMATIFYNAVPAIGTCNLRLSEPNDNNVEGTNMFHRDFNSPVKLMKFFFYLTDVGPKNGPFTYVQGSNREMIKNWSDYHRWPDSEIEKHYGKDRIKHLTANVGDVILGTTNGFHKGLKIEEGRRLMFTINFLVHPEIENADIKKEGKRFFIRKEDFDMLGKNKPVADFLIKK